MGHNLTPGHANLILENLALSWEKEYDKLSGFSDIVGNHSSMDIPHLIAVVGRLKNEIIQMTNEQYIDIFGFGRDFIVESKQFRSNTPYDSPYSKNIRNMIAGVFLNEMSEGIGIGMLSSYDVNEVLLSREDMLQDNRELKRLGKKPLTIGTELDMTEGLAITRAYGNSLEAWHYLFIDGQGIPNLKVGPSPVYYETIVDLFKAFAKSTNTVIDWSLFKKFDEMSETVALVSCLGGAIIDKLSQYILIEIEDRIAGSLDPYNLKSQNCYVDGKNRDSQLEALRHYGATPFHRTRFQEAFPINQSIWGADFDVQEVYNRFDLAGVLEELRELGKNKDFLSKAYKKYLKNKR